MRTTSSLAPLLFVTALLFTATRSVAANVCFGPAQNRGLQFQVFQNAPPPRVEGDASYKYYPLTAVSTMNISQLNRSRDSTIGKYWFQWGNRCHALGNLGCGWNPKGNLVFPHIEGPGGQEIRTFFTSYSAADSCTLAQAAYALGDDPQSFAREGGVRLVARSQSPASLAHGDRLIDVCPLPEERLLSNVAGIALDYEVQDGRSPSQSLDFLLRYANFVKGHGRQVILYTNPLDAPTQIYTGIDATNASQLATAFDAITMVLWGQNREGDILASANAQLAILGTTAPSRVLTVFELNTTSVADARNVRNLILNDAFAGVWFWRNRVQEGGSCDSDVNQKIACLTLGQCQP